MKKAIHLLSGAPGSGKTYYLENHVRVIAPDQPILHRDDVRAQLRVARNSNKYFPVSKTEEYKAWICACASVIIAHPEADHYWFDQTTLGNSSATKFISEMCRTLRGIGINPTDFVFVIERFNTDPETCRARNAKRKGFERVPDHVLDTMFVAPTIDRCLRIHFEPNILIEIHNVFENTREVI